MSLLKEPFESLHTLKNYINGEWVEADTTTYRDIINPANMKTIGRVPISTANELGQAVTAAQDAFPEWRRMTALARARYLSRLRELLEDAFEEISRAGVMEHGKTIDESRGETRRGIENVEVATGMPSLMMGYNLEDIARGIDEYMIRQPLGVFGCIAPFNFPFMVPLWFLPYAVATGNTYIVKPSPWTPISQVKLFELIDEAGFPPGVINMVHGDVDVANAMLQHPDIQGISFVGSTQIGRDIIYKTATAHGKRVQAQCGAKNFLVVMPDAEVNRTIASLMTSFFGNTGQRCLSGANLIIVGDEAFYRRFLQKVVTTSSNIRIGYGLDENIQMGPLQAETRKRRVLGFIDQGITEGADLILDGRKMQVIGNYPLNCFLGPSIFENVTPDMTIAREEIFGPVMSVFRATTLDEAIELVNQSSFGNASSIFTDSGKAARQFQYDVQTGNVGINIGVAAPMAFFPFSGMKDSFFGDLHGQGRDAVNFFTEQKVVIVRWF
jgi:malonate-semialdehyde dehydrogenase (acetylating)/methylmalonate-semialdehyde dehydrogenase